MVHAPRQLFSTIAAGSAGCDCCWARHMYSRFFDSNAYIDKGDWLPTADATRIERRNAIELNTLILTGFLNFFLFFAFFLFGDAVPVCERRVNLLVYSFSFHRHSYIGFILGFASSIHNKLQILYISPRSKQKGPMTFLPGPPVPIVPMTYPPL